MKIDYFRKKLKKTHRKASKSKTIIHNFKSTGSFGTKRTAF